MSEPDQVPLETIERDALAAAVGGLLGEGLPTSVSAAGPLLGLRSIYARAVIPAEPRSRLTALNELLPRLIATMRDPDYREAVQTLDRSWVPTPGATPQR